MFTNSNIIVPTDFSDCAKHAYPYAKAFVKAYGGKLHYCHIIDAGLFAMGSNHGVWTSAEAVAEISAGMMDYANKQLSEISERDGAAGINVQTHLEEGEPAAAIARIAEEQNAELIVISTHGRSGFEHLVFGSTSDHIVRYSPVPVLCVRPDEREFVDDDGSAISIKNVLLPTDLSEDAEKAVPYAVSLCKQFGARLTLLYVNELAVLLPEYLPEMAMSTTLDLAGEAEKTLKSRAEAINDVDVSAVVRTGPAHREIVQTEVDTEADLIVMPTHGRKGLSHVLFGSVAERVVRLAKCPVLTIKPDVLTD